MKRGWFGAALLCAGAVFSGAAEAGIYTDDLTRCLVSSASTQDQQLFVKWVFSALGTHPVVRPYAAITDEQRADLSRSTSALYQRLMLQDCRKQTIDAIKYEGAGSIEAGFGTLGEVAFRNLTSDPSVAAAMGEIANYTDEAAWEDLRKEGGFPEPTKGTPEALTP